MQSWLNYDLNLNDWRAGLLEDYPTIDPKDENALTEKMHWLNDQYLDDERCNLNIQLEGRILVIANLGRWNGRFDGYAIIESGNVKDCLYMGKDCDYAKWYVDDAGEFRSKQSHHDATNYLRYREIKPAVDEDSLDELLECILNSSVTEEQITALTNPIGPAISKVYGWTLNGGAAA